MRRFQRAALRHFTITGWRVIKRLRFWPIREEPKLEPKLEPFGALVKSKSNRIWIESESNLIWPNHLWNTTRNYHMQLNFPKLLLVVLNLILQLTCCYAIGIGGRQVSSFAWWFAKAQVLFVDGYLEENLKRISIIRYKI